MSKEKNIKNISVNALEDATKDKMQASSIYQWNNLDIVVKPFLSLKELFTVVSNIFNTCINSESGEYVPEVRDFAFRRFVVDAYTNITMPTNVEKCYKLICLTGLSDFVLDIIDKNQIDLINWIVSEKIRVAIDTSAISMKKEAENLYGAMHDILSQMEDVFAGVSAEDVKSISEILASGQLSEEQIVNTVIDIHRGES